MQDFKPMYLRLFNTITDARTQVAAARHLLETIEQELEIEQARTEQMYLEDDVE